MKLHQIDWSAIDWQPVREGVDRKAFTGAGATVALHRLMPGHKPSPHKHPHEQIAYIMAGDPSLSDTGRLVLELERAGADVIELPLISVVKEIEKHTEADVFLELGGYDWIVFTSANAVESFMTALLDGGANINEVAGGDGGARSRHVGYDDRGIARNVAAPVPCQHAAEQIEFEGVDAQIHRPRATAAIRAGDDAAGPARIDAAIADAGPRAAIDGAVAGPGARSSGVAGTASFFVNIANIACTSTCVHNAKTSSRGSYNAFRV